MILVLGVCVCGGGGLSSVVAVRAGGGGRGGGGGVKGGGRAGGRGGGGGIFQCGGLPCVAAVMYNLLYICVYATYYV